jgi:DNA-binding NarL/FixJ family response regulator
MGNVGSAIRWSGVPYRATTQLRTQPSWTYYSQVSVASPQNWVLADGTTEARSVRGFRSSELDTHTSDVTHLHSSQPSSSNVVSPPKGDDKPWGPWSLTQRELDVIQLLAEGATNCEISDRLFISQKTTKNHLASIFQKLDVSNRTQALVRAVVMGLVSIE